MRYFCLALGTYFFNFFIRFFYLQFLSFIYIIWFLKGLIMKENGINKNGLHVHKDIYSFLIIYYMVNTNGQYLCILIVAYNLCIIFILPNSNSQQNNLSRTLKLEPNIWLRQEGLYYILQVSYRHTFHPWEIILSENQMEDYERNVLLDPFCIFMNTIIKSKLEIYNCNKLFYLIITFVIQKNRYSFLYSFHKKYL
ncbi:hypothetical protein AK88_00310 [Plasmodium fragile]|uniref:Uncharacterized protein n=1 Tax=Plasmodium fragile TaxID=5857 RepID=A0A0D9QUC0_PLAFR|nr:uncharacterized protein AK88_00310 [Plasmodium fragile]KJP90141.1 hypothetical protein AK88_00310 [Plasmodium fragile]